MALEFVWKITEDFRLINHLDTFVDLDVNCNVHSSFLGTRKVPKGMRVLSTFSRERSCKATLMLPGNKITVSQGENRV